MLTLPMSLKRKFALCSAGLMVSGIFISPALAETLARANGRCSLTDNSYQVFNGYCTVKQKQNGSITMFVVDLENGTRYRFSGPGFQQLHVETPAGIQQNVLYVDQGSKGVFTGADVAGAAVGALIGALLTGGKPASGAAGGMGQPVAELQNLIGRDPGYVESRLTSTGYRYIRTNPRENGTDSFWKRVGSCVDVRSILNRYQSFTYANPSNCN